MIMWRKEEGEVKERGVLEYKEVLLLFPNVTLNLNFLFLELPILAKELGGR